MQPRLTASQEDYLEAIAELIAVEGHAHTKDIADKLHVKMPSVTGALRQLEKSGCIEYRTNYPVQLTAVGEELAADIMRRHRVLKQFFTHALGLLPSQASETACRIEHLVDAGTIRRLGIFTDAVISRTDAAAVRRFLAEALAMQEDPEKSHWQVLPAFNPGDHAVIRKTVPDGGLDEGDTVSVEGLTIDRAGLRVLRDGVLMILPLKDAENIWAELC
ncbi:MAG: metal-dependent transcriptional regulator [Lentisphaeria bacterium]|nr:metal-dependent transcriptional regulator [Lentisphaeria bacterium]